MTEATQQQQQTVEVHERSVGDCNSVSTAAAQSLSRVRLCATPWTAAYQAPPSMGFSRQEYWSGMPLPSMDNFKYIEIYKE